MRNPINWLKTHMYILDIVKFVLILILLGMAISFNIQAAHQAAETRKIGDNTNFLAKRIESLSTDNKKLAQQNKDLSQQLNSKADDINKHVDCIVALFLPNKLPPTTQDIEGCKATPQTQSSSTTAPTKSPQNRQAASQNSTSHNSTGSSGSSGGTGNNTPPSGAIKNICSKIPIVKKVCK